MKHIIGTALKVGACLVLAGAAVAYRLDRFKHGFMIDEKGQGAQPNLH